MPKQPAKLKKTKKLNQKHKLMFTNKNALAQFKKTYLKSGTRDPRPGTHFIGETLDPRPDIFKW